MTKLNIAAIIPLFNKRRYVIEAVESMLQQTRPANEIVIVDDGSTDGSGDLVAEQYGHDPRIQLIHQPNQGVSAARNVAIDVTRSPCWPSWTQTTNGCRRNWKGKSPLWNKTRRA